MVGPIIGGLLAGIWTKIDQVAVNKTEEASATEVGPQDLDSKPFLR